MSSDGMIGQILDGKYEIDKQLGKGGMGTVYLSTHMGTGRPVALKVIAPEFMQRTEFVERFRREAKAAGRLRHPNVVDVTDFGFAKTKDNRDVAYLVMEYLDGCTLGEVLDEEKKLPLSFTIDILEQVCSAVEEAHKQGIIHRDLKPDNIWLEPNQRGGYTVKVLDFGIAKLEESQFETTSERIEISDSADKPKNLSQSKKTVADESQMATFADKKNSTIIAENETIALVEESKTLVADNSESGTMIQESKPESSKEIDSEDGTVILPANETKLIEVDKEDSKGTKVIENQVDDKKSLLKSPSTTNLTRVGAVLGTPLYMSPEQCRGEKLSAPSDIYSLAVIAYQMLSGKLPFTGDYVKVMDGHKTQEPPPLNVKKVPKKLKGIIMKSLSKNPDERPSSAEAFSSKARANSEGIGSLLRRSLVIYTANLPKFLQLAFLTFLPVVVLTLLKITIGLSVGFGVVEDSSSIDVIGIILEVLHFFISIVSSAFLVGMMTWVVGQYLAYPLRPLSLRAAFNEAKKKAKSLTLTVGSSTLLSFVGYAFCLVPGLYISARFMLIAPSMMMEGVKGKAAFKRSMELTKRSLRTVLATALLVYVIPMVAGFSIGIFIILANYSFVQSVRSEQMKEEIKVMKEKGVKPQPKAQNDGKSEKDSDEFRIAINSSEVKINPKKKSKADTKEEKAIRKRVKRFAAITQSVSQFFLLPVLIFLGSFTSVITALLYFKTRQAGGESMQELLGKLDDADKPQSKWQQRVRERLILSGKLSGTTTNPSKSGTDK